MFRTNSDQSWNSKEDDQIVDAYCTPVLRQVVLSTAERGHGVRLYWALLALTKVVLIITLGSSVFNQNDRKSN